MTSSKGTGAGLQDRTEHLRADGELTTDDLEHVSGGKPSAAPKDPPVKYVSYEFSAPTISGAAQVGQTLTATTGVWTGNPTGFGFQWQRCDASGATCVAVTGATSGTYVLGTADIGSTIRVAVTATNAVGAANAVSAPTPAVT